MKKICEKKDCEVKNCEQRHPKNCLYFQQFSYCKFGDFCFYKHNHAHQSSEKISDFENVFNEKIRDFEIILNEKCDLINLLKTQIGQLEDRLSSLEKKEDIQNVETFVKSKNVEVSDDTINNSVNLISDSFDESSNNIPQLDGNVANLENESNLFPFGAAPNIPRHEVWFACDMCTWKFGSEESLGKHRTKKHKWKTSWV